MVVRARKVSSEHAKSNSSWHNVCREVETGVAKDDKEDGGDVSLKDVEVNQSVQMDQKLGGCEFFVHQSIFWMDVVVELGQLCLLEVAIDPGHV